MRQGQPSNGEPVDAGDDHDTSELRPGVRGRSPVRREALVDRVEVERPCTLGLSQQVDVTEGSLIRGVPGMVGVAITSILCLTSYRSVYTTT